MTTTQDTDPHSQGIPLLWRILYKLFNLWLSTLRPIVIESPEATKLLEKNKRVVGTFWHECLILSSWHFRYNPSFIMVSPSKDGDIIAHYLALYGHKPVRASANKGGARALIAMARDMKDENMPAAVVADGSRGPALIAQKGPLFLAREAQAPLFPVAIAAKPCVRMGSWDKTIVPFPFARVSIVIEEPILIPQSAKAEEMENYRKKLEEALNNASKKAQKVLA